ncbi:MAG: UDP-N-acetylglucosamine 2-epimerase (non-hydrolyzing) [bacterium]|nr:UDP-N-acetylglucosamine 2-epimerase (non-hydrolyzing) [bacterium]
MKIVHVVGARPNFMKMAPVFNALKKYKVRQMVVHTGQHYSANMSDVFFKELNIKKPDINLHVGSGTQAGQVADIMKAFEPVVAKEKPDIVLVYGDVNSTVAASMVCGKLSVKVAHVEAGLRSRDLSMPEEINRMITDRLSSLYFTPSKDGDINLTAEGVDKNKIHFVGNVMIDTLVSFLPRIRSHKSKIPFKKFGVVTLHRPSNVDDPQTLKKILVSLNQISKNTPLVFPIHPRTRKMLTRIKGLKLDSKKIMLVDPLGYIEFLSLVYLSTLVITDSGGIQEETTYLGIPCFTMRPNTERPVTLTVGTNTLVGNNFKLLNKKIGEVLKGTYKKGKIPPKWDGKAAERIAKIIAGK